MPWERTADYFGGVLEPDRVHASRTLDIAFLYLAFLLAI